MSFFSVEAKDVKQCQIEMHKAIEYLYNKYSVDVITMSSICQAACMSEEINLNKQDAIYITDKVREIHRTFINEKLGARDGSAT